MEAIKEVFNSNNSNFVKETNPLGIAYYYRQLVDENNFVLLTDKSWNIIFINNLFNKVLRLKNINLEIGDGIGSVLDINNEIMQNCIYKALETKGKWSGKIDVNIDNIKKNSSITIHKIHSLDTKITYNSIIIESSKFIEELQDEYTTNDYLTRVIKNTDEVLVVLDENGLIVNYTEDLYGVFRDRLSNYKGKPFYLLGEEYCQNQIRLDLKKVIETGQYAKNQCEIRIGENILWIKYFMSRLGSSNDKKIMVVINDLSSKDKYEFAMDNPTITDNHWFDIAQEVVFLYDNINSRIVKVNSKFALMLKKENYDYKNINLEDIFYNGVNFDWSNIIATLMKSESYKVQEVQLKFKNEKYLSLTVFPIMEGDKLVKVLFTGKDITSNIKVKKLEEEKNKQEVELLKVKASEKLKGEFIANISHEFKTPINVIYSGLQAIELYSKKQKNDDFDRYTVGMKTNCYRLMKLVENIVDSNKIESKCFTLKLKNVDVVSEIENLVQEIIPYANKKDIEVIFDTNNEEFYSAIDLKNIRRVILNLVSNSIKHTDRGGQITISMNIDEENNNIKLMVKDTGKGIPANYIDCIFKQYKQVDKSFTRDSEGLGVGLYLCKEIIKLHGGKIVVKSQEGDGTIMRITLPILMNIEETMEVEDNGISDSVMVQLSDIYI